LIYCTRTLSALDNVKLAIAISCVENVVENLSLIRSRSNIVVERRGTVFRKQLPRNMAGNLLKVASNYHGYAIYSRTINKRIFGEILFFVWIKDAKYALK